MRVYIRGVEGREPKGAKKMAETRRIRIRGTRSEGKGYVAEITGLSGRYGLERRFLAPVERDGDYAVFALEVGKVYEVKDLGASGRLYAYPVEKERFGKACVGDDGYLLSAEILAKVMVGGKVNRKRLEREYA
jgi:hypothetical protein